VVFSLFAKIPSEGIPYPIFSYAALLPWTFFATSVSFGVPSVVSQMDLVTKIYFPKEILPFSSIIAAFFDFLIASTVFLGLIIFYKVTITVQIFWYPILLSIQVLLTLGIVLLASAINVFYRDIRFVIPLVTQLWMYASPIIYPVSSVPKWLRPFYLLNPMAPIIDGYRRVVLLGSIPDLQYLTISAFVSIVLFIVGYYYFKRVELSFADFI
jgi:lipopolysaccharide transport system permease protein